MTLDQIAEELVKPTDTEQGQRVLDLLERAHALIKDPAHWTQFAPARDHKGNPCGPNNPDAVCFCSVGAIQSVSCGITQSTLIHAVRGQIERTNPTRYALSAFNDTGTHAEVMQAWERAIEQQRKGIQS